MCANPREVLDASRARKFLVLRGEDCRQSATRLGKRMLGSMRSAGAGKRGTDSVFSQIRLMPLISPLPSCRERERISDVDCLYN